MSRLGALMGGGGTETRVPMNPDSDEDSDESSGDEGFRVGAAPEDSGARSQQLRPVQAVPMQPPPLKQPSESISNGSKKLSDNFIPSPEFAGAKDGFEFKEGPLGKGYYKALKPKKPAPIFQVPGNSPGMVHSGFVAGGGEVGTPRPSATAHKEEGGSSARDMLKLIREKEKAMESGEQSNTVPRMGLGEDSDEDSDEEEGPRTHQKSKDKGAGSRFGGMVASLHGLSSKGKRLSANFKKGKEDQFVSEPTATGTQERNVSLPVAPPSLPPRPSSGTPIHVPPPRPEAPPAISAALPPSTTMTAPKTGTVHENKPVRSADRVVSEWCAASGLQMPEKQHPFGSFAATSRMGAVLVTAGHGSQLPSGGFVRGGPVGEAMPAEQAQVALTLALLSALRSARAALENSLDTIDSVALTDVEIVTTPGFEDVWGIAQTAGDLLQEWFGNGKQGVVRARGVNALPNGVPVTVALTLNLTES